MLTLLTFCQDWYIILLHYKNLIKKIMFKTIKKHLKKVYAISFALTLFVVGSAIAASTNDGNMHTLYVTDKSLSSSD